MHIVVFSIFNDWLDCPQKYSELVCKRMFALTNEIPVENLVAAFFVATAAFVSACRSSSAL